ncbi:hypothetical protein FB45DRAFT_867471 [Roridomyces roridus]|uniref:Uncharacterized protein n=1 Tax=Roridomyces roridus TaxID=1738132 RepID=A0AAD7BRE0_9AGAR|nr:hypothetical protein FB45DRAFT_867471 [Roridomyces roridus]
MKPSLADVLPAVTNFAESKLLVIAKEISDDSISLADISFDSFPPKVKPQLGLARDFKALEIALAIDAATFSKLSLTNDVCVQVVSRADTNFASLDADNQQAVHKIRAFTLWFAALVKERAPQNPVPATPTAPASMRSAGSKSAVFSKKIAKNKKTIKSPETVDESNFIEEPNPEFDAFLAHDDPEEPGQVEEDVVMVDVFSSTQPATEETHPTHGRGNSKSVDSGSTIHVRDVSDLGLRIESLTTIVTRGPAGGNGGTSRQARAAAAEAGSSYRVDLPNNKRQRVDSVQPEAPTPVPTPSLAHSTAAAHRVNMYSLRRGLTETQLLEEREFVEDRIWEWKQLRDEVQTALNRARNGNIRRSKDN